MDLKENWEEYKKILDLYEIKYLYHFTDKENLNSIIKNNGLLSWSYCINNGIIIPKPGSNQLSRDLDLKKGLENYVRLSFMRYTPMLGKAIQGRINHPIWLEISTKVIYWKGTLFSNINATSENAEVGDTLEHFKRIKFELFKKAYTIEDREFYQAEILVNEKVPLKYINKSYYG